MKSTKAQQISPNNSKQGLSDWDEVLGFIKKVK